MNRKRFIELILVWWAPILLGLLYVVFISLIINSLLINVITMIMAISLYKMGKIMTNLLITNKVMYYLGYFYV